MPSRNPSDGLNGTRDLLEQAKRHEESQGILRAQLLPLRIGLKFRNEFGHRRDLRGRTILRRGIAFPVEQRIVYGVMEAVIAVMIDDGAIH
jgi:hypothetical protein